MKYAKSLAVDHNNSVRKIYKQIFKIIVDITYSQKSGPTNV